MQMNRAGITRGVEHRVKILHLIAIGVQGDGIDHDDARRGRVDAGGFHSEHDKRRRLDLTLALTLALGAIR